MDDWRKSKFCLSDGDDYFEGYTNGLTWNGWSCPVFTQKQVVEVLNSETSQDFRFVPSGQLGNYRDYPILIIYHGNNEEEIIESYPLFWENEDGSIETLEVYDFSGWEFMEIDEK